ncbi:AbrB/MazE/SpoVT family DNA-binding domain-containing protein [Patescibacteria group bacterium]|jgi:antitoxin MazE|nr:AbrB/MazE/SpoVT family DNA-binding domain-containing protein [Patescibacteria group bacterium]
MNAKVQKWGNSLGVRLPKALTERSALRDGTLVELTEDAGRIVLTPAQPRVDRDALIAEIDADNLHGEESWGAPLGREVW